MDVGDFLRQLGLPQYEAAFRDRPGFPGWAQARWVEWIADDEDFRPEWTLLATVGDADAGFIVGGADGWITQLGVVPSARGRDIGAFLIGEVVGLMRSAGEAAIKGSGCEVFNH